MVVSGEYLKNTCLLFKCIWTKVESSGKIREFCREQNVETMIHISLTFVKDVAFAVALVYQSYIQ